MKKVGGPYHNVSDIMRQYAFEGVDRINVVVIGQNDYSQFDMGVQLSLFSTHNTHLFEENWGYFALGLFALLALYFLVLTLVYTYKA